MSPKNADCWCLHPEWHQLPLGTLFFNEHQCEMTASWLFSVCLVLEHSGGLGGFFCRLLPCGEMWFLGMEATLVGHWLLLFYCLICDMYESFFFVAFGNSKHQNPKISFL